MGPDLAPRSQLESPLASFSTCRNRNARRLGRPALKDWLRSLGFKLVRTRRKDVLN